MLWYNVANQPVSAIDLSKVGLLISYKMQLPFVRILLFNVVVVTSTSDGRLDFPYTQTAIRWIPIVCVRCAWG